MRFVRHGEIGQERPGLIGPEGELRDLSGVIDDLGGEVLGALPQVAAAELPRVEGTPRLGVPIAGIGKLVAIGLNYSDHAAETGMPVPKEPILFMKATSCIVGPDDPVVLPRGHSKVDWEIELGIVIGRAASYVTEEDALNHIAGFTIVNDVSERAFQLERGGQWTKGKSCDTFGPIGPWLVTPDEIADPQDLAMSLKVNGEVMQSGTTRTMVFDCAKIVSYVSQLMSLQPGDVIATGTPPGVGMGKTPQRWLNPGDVMELEIAGLGRQRQEVLAPR
ncbi:ureidoglycolate lyase [Poseidonocella pacifica]|uniref:Ureidoglycolate lyase n=1 Tax=Poseidonocella pacifica TaxID=871651 RepID=A0A1I0VAR7_9RHOB|nr:fumarylacetoacetate hydrolase family protein [Poseidonocella pacifica]SFA72686.1 ureidoglycolate lyase [Poseidonocella pacifica]